MPWYLRGVLQTLVLHDRQTDVGAGCGLCSGLWSSSTSSQPWFSSLWKILEERAFVEGRFLAEGFQNTIEVKKKKLDSLERVRRETVRLYQHYSSPRVARLRAKRDFLGPWFFSCGEKREHVNELPASQAVKNTDKETHFYLAPSRVLNFQLHYLGQRYVGWRM